MTSEKDLSWALERVKTFDPSKGLMPYQRGMLAMAEHIERLETQLAAELKWRRDNDND